MFIHVLFTFNLVSLLSTDELHQMPTELNGSQGKNLCKIDL